MNSFLFLMQYCGFIVCFIWGIGFLYIFNGSLKKYLYLAVSLIFFMIGMVYNICTLRKSGIKNNFKKYTVIFITSLLSLVCIAQFLIETKLFDANLIGDVVGGTVSLVSILFALYKYVEVKDDKKRIEPTIILKKGIYKENDQYFVSSIVSEFSIKVLSEDPKKKVALLGFCINDPKTVYYIEHKNKNYDDRIYNYQNDCQLSDSDWSADYEQNDTFSNIPVYKLKKGLKISYKSEVVALLMDEGNNITPFTFRLD